MYITYREEERQRDKHILQRGTERHRDYRKIERLRERYISKRGRKRQGDRETEIEIKR